MIKRFTLIWAVLLIVAGYSQTLNTEVVVAGGAQKFASPKVSPSGKFLAYTTQFYNGIFVLNLENNQINTINDETGSGWGFAWAPDSKSILFRASKYNDDRRADAIKVYELGKGENTLIDYRSRVDCLPVWMQSGLSSAIVLDRKMMKLATAPALDLTKSATNFNEDFILSGSTLMYFDKTKSSFVPFAPTQSKNILNFSVNLNKGIIAYEIMGGSLILSDFAGNQIADLGNGGAPQFNLDGSLLVYHIALDDGHNFTSANIHLYDLAAKTDRVVTSKEILALHPSFGVNNSIYFQSVTDGSILKINLENK